MLTVRQEGRPSGRLARCRTVPEKRRMGRSKKASKRSPANTILRLPDLEQLKNAVLNSLAAASSQESLAHAIDEWIGWHCSEPRLALNRSVVLRYRAGKLSLSRFDVLLGRAHGALVMLFGVRDREMHSVGKRLLRLPPPPPPCTLPTSGYWTSSARARAIQLQEQWQS